MAEEITRLYNIEDELLLTRAQTQKDALSTDLASFTARFPWIVTAYLTSYQTDIDTAEAFPDDDTVMTDIKVLTSDVNASVAEGKSNLNILFLYSEITYPDDKVKQRVFGQDRMEKARNDQEKMMNLLEHANSFADKNPYKADLLAKGYTQVEIDALLTVADNIRDKNRLQENAKASRPVTTQDRIIVYNTVFSRMRLIFKCAQVVFAGNAAKIEQYRVYPPQATPSATTLSIHASNASTGENFANLTVTVAGTALTDITDDGGIANLDLGVISDETVTLEVTNDGIDPQTFSNLPIIPGEDNVIELEVVPGV